MDPVNISDAIVELEKTNAGLRRLAETLRTYPTYDRAQPGESFVRGVAIGLLACVAGLGVLYVAVMILAGMGMPRG